MKSQDACFKPLLFFLTWNTFPLFLYSVFTSYTRCVGTLILLQYVQHHQFISCCIVHRQGRRNFGCHINQHNLWRYLLHFEAVELFVIWCHLCPLGVSVHKVVYVIISSLFILSNLCLICVQFMLACVMLTSQWHNKPSDSSFRFIFIDKS